MGTEVVDKKKVPDLQSVPVLFYRDFQCRGSRIRHHEKAKHSFKVSSLNLETEKPEEMRFWNRIMWMGNISLSYQNIAAWILSKDFWSVNTVLMNNGRLDLDLKIINKSEVIFVNLSVDRVVWKPHFLGKLNLEEPKLAFLVSKMIFQNFSSLPFRVNWKIPLNKGIFFWNPDIFCGVLFLFSNRKNDFTGLLWSIHQFFNSWKRLWTSSVVCK